MSPAIIDRYRCPQEFDVHGLNVPTADIRGLPSLQTSDLSSIADHLRLEQYVRSHGPGDAASHLNRFYYFVRPTLPTSLRRQLQRIYFRASRKTVFPSWPLDLTVDELMEKTLLLTLQESGAQAIPF